MKVDAVDRPVSPSAFDSAARSGSSGRSKSLTAQPGSSVGRLLQAQPWSWKQATESFLSSVFGSSLLSGHRPEQPVQNPTPASKAAGDRTVQTTALWMRFLFGGRVLLRRGPRWSALPPMAGPRNPGTSGNGLDEMAGRQTAKKTPPRRTRRWSVPA